MTVLGFSPFGGLVFRAWGGGRDAATIYAGGAVMGFCGAAGRLECSG